MQAVRYGVVVHGVKVEEHGTRGSMALDFGDRIMVILETPEDCDEVIRAAVEAKRRIAGVCGDIAPNTGRPCTETGEHAAHRNGMVVWGPGITEPAAVAS